MLCVTHYEVTYANCDPTTQTGCPTEPSSETLIITMLDDLVILKGVKPYTLESQCCNGYLQGIASLYFTPAESTAFGFDTDPMTDFTIVVASNPLTVSGGLSTTLQIQADSLSAVTMYVQLRNRAVIIEPNWNHDLLDTTGGVDKLSVDGETYFVNAVPRLREMAKDLFSDVQTTPEIDLKTHDVALDTTSRNYLQNAGGNAAFYDDSLNDAGAALGLPGMVFKTLIATLLSVALAAYVFHTTKNMVMAVIVFPLCLAALATMSIGTMGMVFMIAFASVFMLVWVFILKGA